MKKKFLTALNVLLGAASLGLAGCHSTQNTAAPQPVKYGPFDGPKKYGPPPMVVTEPAPEEPIPEEESQPLPPIPQAPQEPEPVVCKYGVPMPD